jgi:hypothetical protein
VNPAIAGAEIRLGQNERKDHVCLGAVTRAIVEDVQFIVLQGFRDRAELANATITAISKGLVA